MFRTRFRKSLLLIGGSGEFGSAVTRRFARPLFKRWNVFNIDSTANADATHNFIVDLTNTEQQPFTQSVLHKLNSEMKDFADGFDAMVNLASVDRD